MQIVKAQFCQAPALPKRNIIKTITFVILVYHVIIDLLRTYANQSMDSVLGPRVSIVEQADACKSSLSLSSRGHERCIVVDGVDMAGEIDSILRLGPRDRSCTNDENRPLIQKTAFNLSGSM